MFKALTPAFIVSAALLTSQAQAADSLDNTSKAAGESVIATAKLAASGVQVVAGVAAIPVMGVGSAAQSTGEILQDSGEAVWTAANTPLEVSDETVVAQPAPTVPYDAQATNKAKPQ
ncbi:hypothetical protein [Asticcacaulis machinosus]|uniref:Uncharacterized protein n=1 Tax=Asticcacaulis machinosus TaxID=2984211 RepID=A0ABT5HJ97_9CAUL|nr:hypothetical protein [Asticcacaulis machinosus]MDC7676309.1 hypothetical protein [Asticcacaulis machinosus]